MRYTGPKNRLARREKTDLSLKTVGSKAQANLLRRLNLPPGQHALSRQRKLTDFGVQLREKQKLKRIYGLTEKQMKNYFNKAKKSLGNTSEQLIQLLECRLDNCIYKLGLAPTRASARQLVTHGHARINGKKVSIPSFQVGLGDIVSIKTKTQKIPYVLQSMEKKDIVLPEWLKREGTSGKISAMPLLTHFTDEVNTQLVIEFYSR